MSLLYDSSFPDNNAFTLDYSDFITFNTDRMLSARLIPEIERLFSISGPTQTNREPMGTVLGFKQVVCQCTFLAPNRV